jgi:hypothetical protein
MKNPVQDVLDSKALAKANARFKALPKAKQRVAIAKDVLLQLKLKKIVATPGTYCKSSNLSLRQTPDLQKALLKYKNATCNVCGIGAAFLSMARLGDDAALGDDYHHKLQRCFSQRAISNIETAFEGWYSETDQKARAFYQLYPDATDRLTAIFENIIKHKGNFVPTAKG